MYYMYNIKLIMFVLSNNMYNIGIKRWIISILEEKKICYGYFIFWLCVVKVRFYGVSESFKCIGGFWSNYI